MAGVVVGMETDEIAVKDSKEDLATDGEDPNNRRFRGSVFPQGVRRLGWDVFTYL